MNEQEKELEVKYNYFRVFIILTFKSVNAVRKLYRFCEGCAQKKDYEEFFSKYFT